MRTFRDVSWKMPNPRVAQVSRLLHRSIGHTHQAFTEGMVQRIRKKPTISTQAVDFKTPHSAKTKQAWRYPGGRIVRAPSTSLGSGIYTDPKDPSLPRRKQESNFFITINSNKSPDTPENAALLISQMEKMLKGLSDESVLSTYLKFGPSANHDGHVYQDDKYTDVVHSIDWKAAVETGDNLNRVHAHIWLTITHYSQIQINVQMLMYHSKRLFNHEFGDIRQQLRGHAKGKETSLRMTKQPYVHVKLLPQSDWTDVMRQYIHKGMMGE